MKKKCKHAYLKRYKAVGQILWERDGFFKITFIQGSYIKTEIFILEEFQFKDRI